MCIYMYIYVYFQLLLHSRVVNPFWHFAFTANNSISKIMLSQQQGMGSRLWSAVIHLLTFHIIM